MAIQVELGNAPFELGYLGAVTADLCVMGGHCVLVALGPGIVLVEFDFEGETVGRLGMPEAHRHP